MRKPIDKKAFITRILRRGSYKWPGRTKALQKARVSRGQYQCVMCGPDKTHDRHSIALDHKIPVIDPATGFTTWDDFIERLFCEEDNFQCLCDFHHNEKTQGENIIRRQTRKEANDARKSARKKAKKKDPKTNKHTKESLDDFLSECGIIIEDKE